MMLIKQLNVGVKNFNPQPGTQAKFFSEPATKFYGGMAGGGCVFVQKEGINKHEKTQARPHNMGSKT